MNIENIKKVKEILSEWNPLKERSALIEDINDYETEATDILSHLAQNSSEEQISKMINIVLYQAFDIIVNTKECDLAAE